jgi:glycosyltransferase involved in cell wall biosynthesis
MTHLPLVSLIMPVWRPNPEWLLQAVRSALAQRECAIELIVVDDGCPQPVADLLGAVEDQRMRVVRVEHRGVSAARNAGTAVARGEYVRFIDCDDVIGPDSTSRLLRLTKDGDAVVAYGATVVCDRDLRPLWKMASRREGVATIECLLNRFTVTLHSLIFPRPVLALTGEWDTTLSVCEDWDFVLRALEHARVRGTRATATYHRRHGSSASTDFAAGSEGALRVIERYFERHPEQRGTALERRVDAMFRAMEATGDSRKRFWRRRPFWQAAVLDPHAAASVAVQSLLEGRLGRTVLRRPDSPPSL